MDCSKKVDDSDHQKSVIRTLVKSLYQTQKLRIETGNRLGANFRRKLGIPEGEEPDEEQQDILDDLRSSYKRITDGIADVTKRPTYEFDGLISSFTELRMVDHYIRLDLEEGRIKRDIKDALEGIPIWEEFLKDVTGVGPTMAGVLISELDPHKAPYPVSFWTYCGLDTVSVWYLVEEEGRTLEKPKPVSKEASDVYEAEMNKWLEVIETKENELMAVDEDGNAVRVYKLITKGRSRRREHMVEKEYEDSEGNVKTRMSLSYNPFIKSKLMGVLASSFLRTGSEYREHYDRYRNRIENDPHHEDKTKAHIHQMSLRYMVKEFLKHLHLKWRDVVGLPVPPPYHVAKQNGNDHGLEEKLGIEYDWDEYEDRKQS